MTGPNEVLKFWFEELKPEQQFKKDLALDRLIKERFGALLEQAARGELASWRETPEGRLAEIIVLDQFSRNIFRDDARSFAQDPMALALAQEAVRDPRHGLLPVNQRAFLYMPYMHSESLKIHDDSRRLFSQPGLENNLKFEEKHREILERFGRYPHRNAILGRVSTPEEIEFLKQPGSSF